MMHILNSGEKLEGCEGSRIDEVGGIITILPQVSILEKI